MWKVPIRNWRQRNGCYVSNRKALPSGNRLGLLVLILLTVTGCEQLAPRITGNDVETETAVQQRLWHPWMLPHGEAASSCEVNQVLRPALGCRERTRFFTGPLPTTRKGILEIKAKRPEILQSSFGLVQAEIHVPDLSAWFPAAPFAVSPGTREIQRRIGHPRAVEKEHRTILRFRPMLASKTTWRTATVWPLASSVLNFDLAILPEAIEAGARSARVRVFAQTEPDPRKLVFEKIIDAKEPAAWKPQAVSLAAFAGQPTSLIFEATPWPPAAQGFSAPLIGAPMLTYQAAAENPIRNVLLISLDTLRGDHVGAVRNGRALTPNLDKFAEDAVVFEQAMTTYPSTTASHMSLMTGLYPAAHNTDHPGVTVSNDIPMLAEILGREGFATAAVTENAMLAASSGFSRGFDYYREERDLGLSVAQGQIEKTFAAGSAWMQKHKDDRFFLFLHTYQVHGPYRPPPEYDVFVSDMSGVEKGSLARRAISQINAYAGEVLYTDAIVGELMETIQRLGLAENTLIIITSDHGEEFGMHGHIGHSQTPYESVMRVPLLIRAPGSFDSGARIDSVVSLVDILPTVLAVVEPPTSELTAQRPAGHGLSLLRMLDGSPPAREAVFAESRRPGHRSVVARTNTHRFITYKNADANQLIFDLRVDRSEQTNLTSPPLRTKGRQLAQRYERFRPKTQPVQPRQPKAGSVDPETAAKLRALGYTD